MANFKIPENKEDISWFDLPLNRTMKLLQWGGDATGNKLKLALDRSLPSVVLNVLPDKVPAASTLFTLQGSAITSEFGVTACVTGTTNRYSADLKVQVGNSPTKQPGYTVDLLSDVALHGNTLQVYRYSRIMRDPPNNTHILSQRTTGVLNCGNTAAAYDQRYYQSQHTLTISSITCHRRVTRWRTFGSTPVVSATESRKSKPCWAKANRSACGSSITTGLHGQ
jgi:hypothetical protein